LTAISKPPSVRVAVRPSSSWSTTDTRTPSIGVPLRRSTLPRSTAARAVSIAPGSTSFWIGLAPL
jgi:hypothetical protein